MNMIYNIIGRIVFYSAFFAGAVFVALMILQGKMDLGL
jgi:hypothetical protein